jgi:hypothetical protein
MFAYGVFMYQPNEPLHPFVIVCKGCQQNIPAPFETMPDSWIIADCSLCGARCRYLPADIFQGRLSHAMLGKRSSGATRR